MIEVELYYKPMIAVPYIRLNAIITRTGATFQELLTENPSALVPHQSEYDEHVRIHSVRRRYEAWWEKTLRDMVR